jgi:hypothetical protein
MDCVIGFLQVDRHSNHASEPQLQGCASFDFGLKYAVYCVQHRCVCSIAKTQVT